MIYEYQENTFHSLTKRKVKKSVFLIFLSVLLLFTFLFSCFYKKRESISMVGFVEKNKVSILWSDINDTSSLYKMEQIKINKKTYKILKIEEKELEVDNDNTLLGIRELLWLEEDTNVEESYQMITLYTKKEKIIQNIINKILEKE